MKHLRPLVIRAIIATMASWLTACSTLFEMEIFAPSVSPATREALWREHHRRLSGLQAWRAAGRMAIRSDKGAWHIGWRWRQEEGRYRIRIRGPLALGSAEISGIKNVSTVLIANRRTYTATDPDTLARKILGWRVPVRGLRDWLLGRPTANAPVEDMELDDKGRLEHLRQSGWRIDYPEYRVFDGIDLPTGLTLENARGTARVRISEWLPISWKPSDIDSERPAKRARETKTQGGGKRYVLQVASFRYLDEAVALKKKLHRNDLAAWVQTISLPDRGTWYRVRMGPYGGPGPAKRFRARLLKRGFPAPILLENHIGRAEGTEERRAKRARYR